MPSDFELVADLKKRSTMQRGTDAEGCSDKLYKV